jgi:uncharacterized repeat protein (TIGR03803 family)
MITMVGRADSQTAEMGAVRRLGILKSFPASLFALAMLLSQLAIVYAFNGKNKLTAGTSLVRDKAGNVYGASTYGSVRNCAQGPCGAIYKIDSKGKETTLYNFKGPPDGANPVAVMLDASGTIYGTTEGGGTSTLQYCGGGCGTVFKLTSSGKETVLHSFSKPPGDGILPRSGVIRDSNRTLYGTTYMGGEHTAYGNPGEGTVYKIVNGKESLLYDFTGGDDGGLPNAALLLSGGVLYGTTVFGGSSNNRQCVTVFGPGCGTVFKVEHGKETVLYTFNNQSDGGYTAASLIADKSGNLYGTASLGGDLNCQFSRGNPPGCGVVFKVTPSGEESVLYTFKGKTDGAWPSAALVMDAADNLYGTTVLAGNLNCQGGYGCGTIFKLDTAGKFTVLHTFVGSDGRAPTTLIQDGQGKFYGVASGGTYDYGVVYELTP